MQFLFEQGASSVLLEQLAWSDERYLAAHVEVFPDEGFKRRHCHLMKYSVYGLSRRLVWFSRSNLIPFLLSPGSKSYLIYEQNFTERRRATENACAENRSTLPRSDGKDTHFPQSNLKRRGASPHVCLYHATLHYCCPPTQAASSTRTTNAITPSFRRKPNSSYTKKTMSSQRIDKYDCPTCVTHTTEKGGKRVTLLQTHKATQHSKPIVNCFVSTRFYRYVRAPHGNLRRARVHGC